MSFNTIKIPLPIVLFGAGIIPWAFLVILALFYEPVGHVDPFITFVALIAFSVAPICFLIGIFQSLKFTGKHRRIGLTLNGISLAVLFSLLAYGWLGN